MQRPRGITASPDGKHIYVCASDDNLVRVYDTATYEELPSLPSGPDPELFVLHPSGNPLYIANEDDNIVTVVDVETRQVLAEVPVGVEPEGMGVSPDGRIVVNTSETTNMAHMIDTETFEIVANVLVDSRPRFAEYNHDGSLLFVSAEIGGTVSVIDTSSNEIVHKITFEVPGVLPEALQPVGVRVTADGSKAYVALGPANRVAVVDTETFEVDGLPAGRAAGLAAGLLAGREVPLHHQRQFQRHLDHRRRDRRGREVGAGGRAALGRRRGRLERGGTTMKVVDRAPGWRRWRCRVRGARRRRRGRTTTASPGCWRGTTGRIWRR